MLGLTPASVSRSIKRLEGRLGVRLFARTTRTVKLTVEGEAYWAQCREALELIAAAERSITGKQRVPSGRLRISVGTLYGNFRLLPQIHHFTDQYPQIDMDISLSNRVVDILEEGFDLAVRIGTPPDSRLISRKLEDASLGVFATPGYLTQHGTPQTLADLDQHNCLQFVLPSNGRPMPWLFNTPAGEPIDYVPSSKFRVLDDAVACVNWGLSGGGLFQTYHFIVQDALARGDLIEVMQSQAGRSRQFSVVYPQNKHVSARVRALINFMVAHLSR